jgi:molybdopterin-guanine dinucleotide biosynthesis protein A
MIEPLHAIYRRSALLAYLEQPEHASLHEMVGSMRVRFVEIDELRRLDPELKTFTNVNKIEELERMKRG